MTDTPDDTARADAAPQDPDPLPARLRAARRAYHLTRTELEQRTGVLACLIRRVERGEQRLTLSLLDTLTSGLGVRVQALLGTDDLDAVRHHLELYMSPQVRDAVAAIEDMLQGTLLDPHTLPTPDRMALAAKLRQYARDGLEGL